MLVLIISCLLGAQSRRGKTTREGDCKMMEYHETLPAIFPWMKDGRPGKLLFVCGGFG